MAFCGQCGTAVVDGTAFCAGCGGQVGMGAAPAVVSSQSTSSGIASNTAAALAYVLGFITGILFLVLEPYKHDRFVRFHAMQSIFFCVAYIVFSIAWALTVNILMSITLWMGAVLTPLGLALSLGFFVFWLYLMYQAYSHREFRIPFIGAIAARQVG